MTEEVFRAFTELVEKGQEFSEEEYLERFTKLSAIEKRNVSCLEYIAADIYPANRFDRDNMKLSMRVAGKVYYPIVGWDPDQAGPSSTPGQIPPMRKWLNGQKKRKIHNSREDKTYVLYG